MCDFVCLLSKTERENVHQNQFPVAFLHFSVALNDFYFLRAFTPAHPLSLPSSHILIRWFRHAACTISLAVPPIKANTKKEQWKDSITKCEEDKKASCAHKIRRWRCRLTLRVVWSGVYVCFRIYMHLDWKSLFRCIVCVCIFSLSSPN